MVEHTISGGIQKVVLQSGYNAARIWSTNVWDSILALLTNCVCLDKLSKHLMPPFPHL